MADPIQPTLPNGLMQALIGRLLPQNRLALLGSGMASNAAADINGRAYKLHVQEAQAMGQQPLSPEQFQQMQQRGTPG